MAGCKFFSHREGNVFNEAIINQRDNRNILSDGKFLFQAFLHNT